MIEEPLERSLSKLVGHLLTDRREIAAYAMRLASLPEDLFVQPAGFMRDMISTSLGQEAVA